MSARLRFSYSDLHQTIADGAAQIVASDFQFDVILAIGGGGFIPARILRTYVEKPLIAISLARYHPDEPPSDVPHKLQWVDGVNNMITGKRVLLVDEVDDERTTLAFAIGELLTEGPTEIGVFVMHNKLKEKKADYPEFVKYVFVGKDIEDVWVDYPWDARDIIQHEKDAASGGLIEVNEEEAQAAYRN
jgi:hypoxanthine phosphoribosyltransferase